MYNLIIEDYKLENEFDVIEATQTAISIAFNVLDFRTDQELNIVLINNDAIHAINKKCRQVDKPTDVISFSFAENNLDFNPYLGEIYISTDKVLEQSSENMHSIKREYCFLLIHGLLHVLGYNHIDKNDEKIMFDLQDKILSELEVGR